MRRELEDANGKVIVWDALEIEGGAQLITLRPFHRDLAASKASKKRVKRPRLSQEEFAEACRHDAEKLGRKCWEKRVPRNASPYKNRHGRVFEGMRPEHLAWLKGWNAAAAEYLIASGGRPRPPRREKKAASA